MVSKSLQEDVVVSSVSVTIPSLTLTSGSVVSTPVAKAVGSGNIGSILGDTPQMKSMEIMDSTTAEGVVGGVVTEEDDGCGTFSSHLLVLDN